jgi:photosystem II stability/assembly factor-like uncharacterized protein
VGGQGKDVVLISDDGKTFVKRNSPGKGLRRALLEDQGLWVVGEWGYAAFSSKLGASWQTIDLRTEACLFGITRAADGLLWIVGEGGYVATSNDGKSFRRLNGIDVTIASITPSSRGVLLTTDAPGHIYLAKGRKLQKLTLTGKGDINCATVTRAGTIIAVGARGIFRSTDGGKRFSAVPVPTREVLDQVDAGADGSVVAVGGNKLLFSSDDGASFRLVSHKHKHQLWSCRHHEQDFLIGGDEGLILRFGNSPKLESLPSVDRADELERLQKLTRAALKHPKKEDFASALARLRTFGDAARKAGHQKKKGRELVIETDKPLSAAAIAKLEKALGVSLPPSCRELFQTIGPLSIDGPSNNMLRLNTNAKDLDSDQVHGSDYYANVYGIAASKFDWETVDAKFARIALAVQFFEDDDEHEDGDVITLISPRGKRGEAPV